MQHEFQGDPPQEEEGGCVSDGLDLELHYLLPSPGGDVYAGRPPGILLPRRVNQHDVKLGAEGLHVKLQLPQISLHGQTVPGRGGLMLTSAHAAATVEWCASPVNCTDVFFQSAPRRPEGLPPLLTQPLLVTGVAHKARHGMVCINMPMHCSRAEVSG